MVFKPAPPIEKLPLTEPMALETALENHPAIKSAEADVAAAAAQLGVARAALSPRLSLELAANHGRDLVQGRSDDVTAMLRLSYNIARGGADQARINEAYFQVEESREVLNRTRRQVGESVSLAFNAHLTTRDRLVALTRYVEATGATREAYAKQFSIGQRTLLDLLNSENEFFSARIEYLAGVYLELGSMFRVFAGMGLLLDTLEIARPAEGTGATREIRR
jgi:adhesin transport system outer membrane protein